MDCEKITISVNEKGDIFFDEKVIILVRAESIIRKIRPKCEVIILGHENGSYESIFELISLVKKLDREFKNLKSQELFDVNFIELNESEKKEVQFLTSFKASV